MLLYCFSLVNVATLVHFPFQLSAVILFEWVEVGTQPHDDIELLEVHDWLQLGNDFRGGLGQDNWDAPWHRL